MLFWYLAALIFFTSYSQLPQEFFLGEGVGLTDYFNFYIRGVIVVARAIEPAPLDWPKSQPNLLYPVSRHSSPHRCDIPLASNARNGGKHTYNLRNRHTKSNTVFDICCALPTALPRVLGIPKTDVTH